MATRWPLALACAALLLAPAESRAQSGLNLAQATLEDLMNMEVTSASKKEQTMFRTAASVHVLTSEDIRRSGATNIPDALRLVPGLQVATIDASKWAVSARGFNSLWSNKLLVLVDGRSVYTPVSSGVHWDLLDLMLDDIDRIEVVRGPGASVWGANAVNGVINIISKAAVSTQGGLVSLSTGSLSPGIGTFRYGGQAGSRGHYRVFGKHSERGSMQDAIGGNAGDAWHASSAGFRLDLERSAADQWTLQGSLLGGTIGHRVLESMTSYAPAARAVIDARSPTMAGHLLARWTRRPSPDNHLSVQAFWDRTSRQVINTNPVTQTFDLEFQHHFKAGRGHELVWGAGQRFYWDREDVSFAQFLTPSSSRRRLFSAFVQDEFTFPNPAFHVTVGSKLEHQSDAGLELQPTLRLAWFPTARHTVWAAVSRAARTPSRLERGLHVDFAAVPGDHGQLTVFGVRGDANLKTEHTVSTEVGYRINPVAPISLDAAIFHHRYTDLVTENLAARFETAPAPAHLAVVHQLASGMSGESIGAEVLVRWRPIPRWAIDASADWFSAHFHDMGDAPNALDFAHRDPSHQLRLRSQVNLFDSWQLDGTWSYVAQLQGIAIPAYARVDARIGGTIAGLAVSVSGHNLFESSHLEFGGFEGFSHSRVPRSWVARATWAF